MEHRAGRAADSSQAASAGPVESEDGFPDIDVWLKRRDCFSATLFSACNLSYSLSPSASSSLARVRRPGGRIDRGAGPAPALGSLEYAWRAQDPPPHEHYRLRQLRWLQHVGAPQAASRVPRKPSNLFMEVLKTPPRPGLARIGLFLLKMSRSPVW